MELIYQGGHDTVTVPLPDGREPEVKQGDSFDFPDDYAKQLLEQPSNWARPAAPKTPKSQADADALADELGVTFPDDVKTVAQKVAFLNTSASAGDAGADA
jgi:hypothetical protein